MGKLGDSNLIGAILFYRVFEEKMSNTLQIDLCKNGLRSY